MQKSYTKYLTILFLSLALWQFIFVLFTYRDRFLSPYNHEYMGKIYSNSQYVLGPKATTSIGDDGLFAVASYYLFMQGGDPSQIHFESPPLGEYMMGASIWLFRNERIINIIYFLVLFYFMYKLGLELFGNFAVPALAIWLFTLDPLFRTHLIASQLDLPQGLFVFLGIYYFRKGLFGPSRFFWLSSLFLGVAFSVKFFPGIIFLIGLLGVWAWFTKRNKLVPFLMSLSLIPIIYFGAYFQYFMHHPSFVEFVNFQKWVMVWRLGNPHLTGNIFYTILIGSYLSWWESGLWVKYQEWWLVVPLIFIGWFVSPLFFSKKHEHIFLYSWCMVFIIYVAIGTTGVAKYLYPIMPFLTLYGAFSLISVGNKLLGRRKSAILRKE